MVRGAGAPAIVAHFIPHTHTDPGWLNTYDSYYNRDVRPILDTVLREMEASPGRTFAWSETCFFARYWAAASARKRNLIRSLAASSRLEFVGGGWVQHDEALPTVAAQLDNMAEGHAWLRETLGVSPRVGWQLDPFGHSASSAALMGRMGLDAVVLNRIHYKLKSAWKGDRRLEFRWASAPMTVPPASTPPSNPPLPARSISDATDCRQPLALTT